MRGSARRVGQQPGQASGKPLARRVWLCSRSRWSVAGKGNPKTGGRKKGTANLDKTELLQAIRDAVDDQDYHPVVQLARIACDGSTVTVTETKQGKKVKFEVARYSDELRVTAAKEVAQYVAPKLKAIEHTGDAEGFGLNLHMNLGPAKKGNGRSR